MTPTPRTHVVADRDAAYAFVNAATPISRTAEQRGLIQVRDSETIAAVVYDDYNGSNIFMHVAATPGRRWMTRWFLHETFKYPFITLGCDRITGWVSSDNAEAIRFDEHLGFKREAVLHKAGPARQDVFLYVMFREDCRYA